MRFYLLTTAAEAVGFILGFNCSSSLLFLNLNRSFEPNSKSGFYVSPLGRLVFPVSPLWVSMSALSGPRPPGFLSDPIFQCVRVFSRVHQTPVQLLQNRVLTLNPTQRRQGHVVFNFKWSKLPTRSSESLK